MKSIFVSSTFRDMQAERDMLHMEVMPKLQEKARTYGERISFIDLRWGVDTGDMDSESGAKKVLTVCLDEIDRSRPYMLIFLGERYGWIPDARLIENAIAEKGFSIEDVEESVTALEIEYGVLSNKKSAEHCIFCIREPLPYERMSLKVRKDYEAESQKHKEKLESLKKRIENLPNGEVITYRADWHEGKVCGLESLAEQIYESFIKMFEREWHEKKNLSWQDRELMEFELFMEEKRSCFVGRQSLIDSYMKIINDTEYKAFVLQGKEGSGKSSILSKLVYELRKTNYIVFPFICGSSGKSDDLDDMVKQIVYFLEKQLDMPHLGENKKDQKKQISNEIISREKWAERFFQLCELYGRIKKQPLAFVIDALEQLQEDDEIGKFSWFPPFLPQNIVFVVSTMDDFKMSIFCNGVVMRKGFCVEQLELLQKSNKKELIRGILSANRKGLDEIVIRALVNKKASDNPMYLSMLLMRLMMMDSEDFFEADRMGGGGEGLDARMIAIIEEAPQGLQDMSAFLIQEAARRCSPEQAQETLYLLAASRRGLREEDLEAIIRSSNGTWNTVDFSRLLRYMRSYFVIREDGRVDFAYPITRKGLLKDRAMNIEGYQKRIFNYLKTLPTGDSLFINEALYYAKLVDDKEFAFSYLENIIVESNEIREMGANAIRELIADEGAPWFAEVCLLSHTLENIFYEQYIYEYLIDKVLAQPVRGIYKENSLFVSVTVFEEIFEYVWNLMDKFDPYFDDAQEDINLAMLHIDSYINVFLLGVHILWHRTEGCIEYGLYKDVIELLKVLLNYTEKIKEQMVALYDGTILNIEKWKNKWKITEGSEAYKSAEFFMGRIQRYREEHIFYIIKANLKLAQTFIQIGDYDEAMKNIKEAMKYLENAATENTNLQHCFESRIASIAVSEAYNEIIFATGEVDENFGEEGKKRCDKVIDLYENMYRRIKELDDVDDMFINKYYFLLRDAIVKQAYFMLNINPDEAFDYCQKAVKYAEDALKLANTVKNGLAYSEALFLRGFYWYQHKDFDKAMESFEQEYWLRNIYRDNTITEFFNYGALEEGVILTDAFFHVCKIDMIDAPDETEIRLIGEIMLDAWKISCNYIKTWLGYYGATMVNRKYLHALLQFANAMADTLVSKGLIDEALYYCDEALRYWKQCGSPIYPVIMMGNEVYSLFLLKAFLLEKLEKNEESIQTYIEILSFDQISNIENLKTLSWMLKKREEVNWQYKMRTVGDGIYDEIDDEFEDDIDDEFEDSVQVYEEIFFTFDESKYDLEEITAKYSRIAKAYDYGNYSYAEIYYIRAGSSNELWHEKENSRDSLDGLKYRNGDMAYWYERNEKLESAIEYYEKALDCSKKLYKLNNDLQEAEQFLRVCTRIRELYQKTENQERAMFFQEMEIKWKEKIHEMDS